MPCYQVPLAAPYFHHDELPLFQQCLDSCWVGDGPLVRQFEACLANFLNVPAENIVATSSGTAALHLAMVLAGVTYGRWTLVPALTYIATVNAIEYVHGQPVFIDSDYDTAQMSIAQVQGYLEQTKMPRVVVPVHLLGHAVNLAWLMDLRRRHEIVIIEDAAESLGAEYNGQKVGTFGDYGCFSFNANKLITTGAGGALYCQDAGRAERARYLINQARDPGKEWQHSAVGFNYRMSSLNAALGLSQISHIHEHVERKRAIASRYQEKLAGVPGIQVVMPPEGVNSAWWLFTVMVDPEEFGRSSRGLMEILDNQGIESRPLFQPIALSPAYKSSCARNCNIDNARALYQHGLCLPSGVGLTDDQLDRVVDRIVSVKG